MSLNEIGSMVAMQGFSGLSLFTVLLLMALGLAIIFGQMGVINMAHGEFMAIGAYVVYLFSQLTQNFAPGLREFISCLRSLRRSSSRRPSATWSRSC
jgi:urea transport system permease protein